MEYAIVLDFEAVCEDGVRLKPQEIIEFPALLLHIPTNVCFCFCFHFLPIADCRLMMRNDLK